MHGSLLLHLPVPSVSWCRIGFVWYPWVTHDLVAMWVLPHDLVGMDVLPHDSVGICVPMAA